MRLTIIRDMGLISVDSRGGDEQDMNGVPEDVHAIQWYGESGEIEFVDNTPNQKITSLPSWASDKATAMSTKLAEEDAEALRLEEEAKAYAESTEGKSDAARAKRDTLLNEVDWSAGSDVVMSDAMKAYRQALRDVPQQAGFPDTIEWPVKP